MKIDKSALLKGFIRICFDVAYIVLAVRILAPEIMEVDIDLTPGRCAVFAAAVLGLAFVRGVANAAITDLSRRKA